MRASWATWVCCAALVACGADVDVFTEQDRALVRAMRLQGTPVDLGNEYATRDAVARFGQQLFFDDQLSAPRADGSTVACVDCHAPGLAFSDPRRTNVSWGVSGFTGRNSMPLANVGFYRAFGWDGRSDSLHGQVRFAYEAEGTMRGTPRQLVLAISQRYADQYTRFFGPLPEVTMPRFDDCTSPPSVWPCDGMSRIEMTLAYGNLLKAIGAYLTRLVSLDAPIDRFAAGDAAALSPAQKRGLRLFIGKAGCITCHSGAHFSDGEFHALGLMQAGPNVPAVDRGRQLGLERAATNPYAIGPIAEMPSAQHEGRFRTMSLRNVALTAPYFHAGQAATLKDVVWFYNQGGDRFGPNVSPLMVPLGLTDDEQADLVAFLEGLTGAAPAPELACDNARTARQPKCAGPLP